MRLLSALLLVAVAAFAAAAAEKAPGDAASKEALEQTTTVKGNPPDLRGRWLVLGKAVFAGSQYINLPNFWEVDVADGKPQVTVRYVNLPASLQAAAEAANKEKKPWEPSLADLQLVREQWSTLPPADRGISKVATTVSSADAYDEALKQEEATKGASWTVQQVADFLPGGGRPIRDVSVYGVTAATPDGYSGNLLAATIAAAPFPIPIQLKGTFRMYRLESLPERTFWSRLTGVFAGCGR